MAADDLQQLAAFLAASPDGRGGDAEDHDGGVETIERLMVIISKPQSMRAESDPAPCRPSGVRTPARLSAGIRPWSGDQIRSGARPGGECERLL